MRGRGPSASSFELALRVGPPRGGGTSRWYILALFSYLTALQSLVWFTYGSVPDATMAYYGVDESTVDLTLNWGSILFCAVAPGAMWAMTRPRGLQRCVQAAAVLVVAGAALRLVPSALPAPWPGGHPGWTRACVHGGCILNACAGPLVMATPSLLSQVWFHDHERATATAVAVLANNLGTTVGFLLGPALAPSASALPVLLWVELGMAAPALAALVHFPHSPSVPPSPAAARFAAALAAGRPPAFGSGLGAVLRSPAAWLIVLAGGVQNGVASDWQGLIPQILADAGCARPRVAASVRLSCVHPPHPRHVRGAAHVGHVCVRVRAVQVRAGRRGDARVRRHRRVGTGVLRSRPRRGPVLPAALEGALARPLRRDHGRVRVGHARAAVAILRRRGHTLRGPRRGVHCGDAGRVLPRYHHPGVSVCVCHPMVTVCVCALRRVLCWTRRNVSNNYLLGGLPNLTSCTALARLCVALRHGTARSGRGSRAGAAPATRPSIFSRGSSTLAFSPIRSRSSTLCVHGNGALGGEFVH